MHQAHYWNSVKETSIRCPWGSVREADNQLRCRPIFLKMITELIC